MMRPTAGFTEELLELLPKGMVMPEPLVALFQWLEATACVTVDAQGNRYAILHRSDAAPVGTRMSFQSLAAPYMATFAHSWLPNLVNANERLCPFARTGSDGSYAALWRDDDGGLHIVHLGSGSGSTFLGVITDESVAFLRLIAIGYPEVCWSEAYDTPPAAEDRHEPLISNAAYRAWVESTFNVAIPETASEIVPVPGDMSDIASADPFNAWMRRMRA